MARTGRRRTPAFTLLELLVVITIILLISAVTIPAVLPAINHRAVSEAARIVQAQLVQARDTAIRFNAPRGVRFLPDPTYNFASTGILAYNRMVPIEPAPQYSNGMVTIWPVPNPSNTTNPPATPIPSPTWYPVQTPSTPGAVYPYYPHNFASTINPSAGQCLMVEQAPFQGNNSAGPSATPPSFINAPTSWYWNIRVGDKIQINGTGNTYTIVGPCTINPLTNSGANPEMFVNVGQPGDLSGYLRRTYTDPAGNPVVPPVPVEHLYLVNGIDDANLGYVDSGWDGVVDWGLGYGTSPMPTAPADMVADNLFDWQSEKWQGSLASFGINDQYNVQYNTVMANSVSATTNKVIPAPMQYVITRRPVPSQSARETMLPRDVVVDATMAVPVLRTGGGTIATNERSRLPGIDPFSHYADILLLPSGQVVPTTLYSNPTSFSLTSAFYHFWLAERGDVHPPTDLWGLTTNTSPPPPWTANPNPNSSLVFQLPMPQDAYTAYGLSNFTTQAQIPLKGERMMLTLFGRTGQITTNSIEFFSCADINTPYYDSQLGAREAK